MKTSNKNGVVHKTNDHSQFKLLEYNRPIVPLHVRKLMESIAKTNDLHLHPIIVNSDMEVVDGQHRLKAAERLGLDVYYLIDDDFQDDKIIQFNTTSKNWKLDDFLNYWVKHGKEDYIKLEAFIKDIEFPLGITLRWLDISGGKRNDLFKRGGYRFKIPEDTLNKMFVAKKIINYMKVKRIRQNYIARQPALHVAIRSFLMNPLIEADRLLERLDAIPYEIKFSASWQTYFEQFVDIYNYKMREGNRVKLVSKGDDRELIA